MGLLEMLPPREKRATFKDNESWLADWARGGRRTVSGEAVGPNTAMTLGAYFAAIRNISEDIAKMPIAVIQQSGDRAKRNALRNHPAYKLLNVQPNPEMDPLAFRETLGHHAMGWGNGTAEIVHTRGGVPAEMWPMDPSRVKIKREEDLNSRSRLVYEVSGDRGEKVTLPPEKVFDLHGLSFDGIRGYSLARIARESIGLGLAEVKAGAAVFGNQIRPSGVLQVPGKLSKEGLVSLREQWEANYQGTDRLARMAILPMGATFQQMSINPEDAQWIQARGFTVEEMARISRIPPSKLHHLLKANFNTLTMQNMEYHIDTLLSWMIRWEQQIQRKLIGVDVTDVYAKHNANAILRGDIEARYKVYAIGRQWGWLSSNDVLEKEDSDGIGEQGDIYMIPLNMGDASEIDEQEAVPAATSPSDDDTDVGDELDDARKLAIANRVHEQVSGATSAADAVRKIVWCHAPALGEVVTRAEHKKGGKAVDRSEIVAGWINSVATSCVDSIWAVVVDVPKPDAVGGAVRNWSRSSASRILAANGTGDGDTIVTKELALLVGLTCDLLNLDAEKAMEN